MKHIRLLLLALIAACGWSVDLGLGPIPPGGGVFTGGAPPAATQVAYSDGSSLLGDSGFVRSALVLTLDPNTDNTFTTGYGKLGLAPSGTSTQLYLAQASNYNSTDFGFAQNAAGTTIVNAKTGGSVLLRINNATRFTLANASATFPAGVPVTISDTTTSSNSATGCLVLAGGFGCAGVSFFGNNVSTSGGFSSTSAASAASNNASPRWYKTTNSGSAPYDVTGNMVFEAANTAGAGFAWMVGTTPTYTARLDASGLALVAAGGGISIKSGSNARCGTATLAAGTITVANTSVTANTRVLVTVSTAGGTQGFLRTSKVANTSFTVTSSSGTETSVVDWLLVENP